MEQETLYELQEEMKKHLGEDWRLTITQEDTIGGIKDAICCRYDKEGRAVLVYPEDCVRIFDFHVTIPQMGQYLAGLAEDKRKLAFTKPEGETEFRKGLYIQAASAKVHKGFLENLVYEPVSEDIVAIARCRGELTVEGRSSFAVTRETMQAYHMSRGEVMELAYHNTAKQEYEMGTLGSFLRGILERTGMPEELAAVMAPEEDIGVYVLTTKDRIDGANALACPEVLKKACQELGEPYYILPSSVHEILLVRESRALGIGEMEQMVQEVNKQEVAPEDFLSDHVFFYDGKKLMPAVEEAKSLSETAEKVKHGKRIL